MKSSYMFKSKIVDKPIIAVVGGAGPLAALDMQKKMLKAMRKKLDVLSDQDYYRVIVDNNTEIPNRDHVPSGKKHNPIFSYIDSTKKLESMGGDFLVISCNAAHAYYEEIQKITRMQVVNMIEETASFVRHKYNHIDKVGVLSTNATQKNGLYHNAFKKYGIKVIYPGLKYKIMLCKQYTV